MESKQRGNYKEVSLIIIIYEMLLGVFEITLGSGLAILGKQLLSLYLNLSSQELLEDSNDLMVHLSEQIIPNLFEHRFYIATLLIALGLVKIISGIGLIYKKEWAAHLLVGLLVLLIPFDLVGLIKHFSIFDLAYLLIDVLIILYLIHFKPREYLLELKQYFQKTS